MSEWLTGTAERSRAAAAVVADEWAAAPAPPGRLAQHVFLALDGAGLLFYAQWTSDDAHLAWARAHRGDIVSRVDTIVPGIERPGLHRTRFHRSVIHDGERPAGVIAVRTTGADAIEDTLMARPGMLAAHVHLTPDGQRAHIITEWADAPSYEEARTARPGFTGYALHRALVDRPYQVTPPGTGQHKGPDPEEPDPI
ncbi:hypothetical protein [Streptomyces sp. NPDC052225]|uniref:hypothetical protein n=1 Tax=Streptomyces sp. NPDC052225 TaxID=3154949 RepID=UPI003432599D